MGSAAIAELEIPYVDAVNQLRLQTRCTARRRTALDDESVLPTEKGAITTTMQQQKNNATLTSCAPKSRLAQLAASRCGTFARFWPLQDV
jgi:hypothetical protein